MSTRYVGVGGSDANSGLSWALRKLTISGAEATPVVAGDLIYVGPGTYREMLTQAVAGTAGNPITYIGDVTGQNTDGVGGIVRITGSDNDTTATRANCITTGRSYRTYRGFQFDTSTSSLISMNTNNPGNVIIEDCVFNTHIAAATTVNFAGTGTNITVRRCIFYGIKSNSIAFSHTVTVDNAAHFVENSLFLATNGRAVLVDRVGGITVRNCAFLGSSSGGPRVSTALTVGQTLTVNNCLFAGLGVGVQSTTAAELVENYNTFFANATDRTTAGTGANSVAYPGPLDLGTLISGFNLLGKMFAPAHWSPLRAIAGTGEATDDLAGMTRPVTSAKNSWGPVQYIDSSRETTTTRTGGVSIKLADAGRHQMFVPVTAVSTMFSVYVQWETDYTGTKPQMVIKQPGQADTTVTATGSSGSWELLTTTLTPSALPGFVVIELVSSNTAAATNFRTFFDDLTIS